MKSSHYAAPRSMDQCEFQSWGQAIEHTPSGTAHGGWLFVIAVMLVAAIAGAAIIYQ